MSSSFEEGDDDEIKAAFSSTRRGRDCEEEEQDASSAIGLCASPAMVGS